jgi:hypothetical protein
MVGVGGGPDALNSSFLGQTGAANGQSDGAKERLVRRKIGERRAGVQKSR